VKAVQIAPSLDKLLDPLLGLGNHHVAVKRASSVPGRWPVDVRADLGDDGSAKCDVGDEVAVHDVDVEPVCALGYGAGAFFAQVGKVGGEDGGGDDGVGRHLVLILREGSLSGGMGWDALERGCVKLAEAVGEGRNHSVEGSRWDVSLLVVYFWITAQAS
jgi:hypothetical protein